MIRIFVLTYTMGDFTYAKKADMHYHVRMMQVVTAELYYECVTLNFLIDKCRITEFVSSYIVNLTKEVSSISRDMILLDKILYAVQACKKAS